MGTFGVRVILRCKRTATYDYMGATDRFVVSSGECCKCPEGVIPAREILVAGEEPTPPQSVASFLEDGSE